MLVELTEKYLKIEEYVNIYDSWTNWKISKNTRICLTQVNPSPTQVNTNQCQSDRSKH